jgi:large subunit ribosomal protein L10
MPLSKQQKFEAVADIGGVVGGAASVVFVRFRGLTVARATAMRRKLGEDNIGYKVVKKTLLGRALSEQKIEGDKPELEGEIAISYGVDPIAPARAIKQFCREYKDMLAIVGGIFQGVYKNAGAMEEIASIPSREVLLAQIANLLNSPIQRFAIAVNEIAKSKE